MSDLEPYKTLRFARGEIPAGLLREHRLKPGVHGSLRVVEGRLVFVDAGGARHPMEAGDERPIAPQATHHLEDADDAAIELILSRATSA